MYTRETKRIIAMFNSEDAAEKAVAELREYGFDKGDISVLAKDAGQEQKQQEGAEGAEKLTGGIAAGGTLGALVGAAAGAGALAIPGIGPIIAAGPIAALVSGAATGGIAGALVDWGIPEEQGKEYENDIKQGKILVSVKTDEKQITEAQKILRENGAEKMREAV